jgi:hypothetical protein
MNSLSVLVVFRKREYPYIPLDVRLSGILWLREHKVFRDSS